MMSVEQLEPKECFRWFAEIAKIPRGSGHEKAVSDFLAAFAGERGLRVRQDAHNNILITKPGTKGMEQAPTVILQGHMDMVWAKDEGFDFDFTKQPITVLVDGDTVTADRTTLGADNGVALAFILAILDADDIPHPPLEVVVTTEEEVGMVGAETYDVSCLKGEYFINIDSEEEGVFCVSCAGGRRTEVKLPEERVAVSSLPEPDKRAFFAVTVGGLKGGHSGIEIHKQRGNSNRLLIRALAALAGKFDIYLADIKGGAAANVIPSESSAVILAKGSEEALRRELDALRGTFADEHRASDGAGLKIGMKPVNASDTVMTKDTFDKVITMGLLIPDGVIAMDLNMQDQRLVETSNNFAVISRDGREITFFCAIRSSVGSKKAFVYEQVAALARATGASIGYFGDYPAWEYHPESRLRDIFTHAYKELFGKDAKVQGIHAGLECGLFSEKFKKLGRDVDFIAFGPNITGAHSTHEAVSRTSVEHTWKLLKKALASITD